MEYRIGPLSIADWAIIAIDIWAIYDNVKLNLKTVQVQGLLMILAGVLLSVIFNACKPWFDVTEFLGTFIKLILYLFSLFILPDFFLKKRVDLYKIISIYIIVVSVAGVLQQTIVFVGGRESWPLYSFGSTLFGFPSEYTMFSSGKIMRSRTFYSEPGYMGVHLSMLYGLLLFTQKRLSKWLHILFISGAGSTISMSALGLVFFMYMIYFFRLKDRKNIFRTVMGLLVLAMGFVAIFNANGYFRSRIINFTRLKDSSAVVRTFGSLHFLLESPWYGVGPGNNRMFYSSLNLGETMWYTGSGEFFNVIVLAAVTMGYIGMVGLLMLEISAVRKNWKLFMVFLVAQCGWGMLYTTPVWVFMIMAYVVTSADYVSARRYKKCVVRVRPVGVERIGFRAYRHVQKFGTVDFTNQNEYF